MSFQSHQKIKFKIIPRLFILEKAVLAQSQMNAPPSAFTDLDPKTTSAEFVRQDCIEVVRVIS